MLSINTNNASMAAVNAISKSSSSLSTSMERLATGNRINSSADDAAGKQIANRLTAQSSGMGVALSNINDATAMLQTADSMFDEMSDVLGRMKDLSTQAANGTYSDDDLQAMQDEYDELGQQMSDMLQNTTYGGTNLFGVSGTSNTGTDGLFQSAVTFQVGAESSDTMTVNISSQLNTLVTDLSAISNSFSADQADTTGTAGVSGGTELTASGSANQMITSISTAMDDVSQIQSKLGASINRLNDTANNLTSMQDNTEVAIGNIMDTDYATEASNMTKQQVLMQTGITMLKQSNSMSSMVPACCSNGGLADKTRQRCIRHCAPIAGCGVNALFGLRATPPAGGVVLSAAGFFRQTGNAISACFQSIDYSHKNIGTPFANNLTSLSGVINDQPKNHCARNRLCGCCHSGSQFAGEAERAGC